MERPRDPASAASLAQWLIYADAALCAAAVVIALMRGLEPAPAGGADALFALAQFVVFATAAIFTLRWIHRAHAHARAAGATDMMGSPGWAVGWYFIPLANLVMPVIMMRELWKASVNPRDWQAEQAPIMIALWWGFWLAAGFAGVVAFRLELEFGKETAAASTSFAFASDLLAIPALILLGRIVGGVQALQARGAPAALGEKFA